MRYRTVLREAAGNRPRRVDVYHADGRWLRAVPCEPMELAGVRDMHGEAVRLATHAERVTRVGPAPQGGYWYDAHLRIR